MKKILTLAFILLLLQANAQISVNAVTCGRNLFYVRVAITEIFVPAHAVSVTTCPDNSVHDDTEEGNYVECRMALYQDAACTQPISVDPRFFSFARDVPGSAGTVNNPSFIYRNQCPAPMPVGGIYDNNYRVDYSAINIQQCIWECVGSGYYNCYSTDFGVPLNYNIVINCCYAPESLAVHLVDFSGVRGSGGNVLSWELADKQDFGHLELERSFDGVNYSVVYTSTDANVVSFVDVVDTTAYYRLKVYSTNGAPFYSSVVVLKVVVDLKKSFLVSPSPFVNVLHVTVNAVSSSKPVFRLVSVDGRIVFVASRSLRFGVSSFSFDVPPVAKGVYIFSMSDEGGTVTKKVFKQ